MLDEPGVVVINVVVGSTDVVGSTVGVVVGCVVVCSVVVAIVVVVSSVVLVATASCSTQFAISNDMHCVKLSGGETVFAARGKRPCCRQDQ